MSLDDNVLAMLSYTQIFTIYTALVLHICLLTYGFTVRFMFCFFRFLFFQVLLLQVWLLFQVLLLQVWSLFQVLLLQVWSCQDKYWLDPEDSCSLDRKELCLTDQEVVPPLMWVRCLLELVVVVLASLQRIQLCLLHVKRNRDVDCTVSQHDACYCESNCQC